jgi:hypothetical protein
MDSNNVEKMSDAELMRIRKAAFRATRVFPGPAGHVLSGEIFSWAEFGYRLGDGLIPALVDQIMNAESETEAA